MMISRKNFPLHQSADSGGDRITFQRHSTTPSSGNSNFEFGMYSLLMIVSIASITMAVLYSVFSFRIRHKSSHMTTTIAANDSRRLHNFSTFLSCVNYDAGAAVANAQEWVWMSKEQFESGINRLDKVDRSDLVQVRCPLIPFCDHNGNMTNKISQYHHKFDNKIANPISNSKTNITIRVNEFTQITHFYSSFSSIALRSLSDSSNIDFRITPNLSEMIPDDEKYEPESSDCLKVKTTKFDNLSDSTPYRKQENNFSVLIPPNHKSTRIMNSSGLNFTLPETSSPPPIPLRTRHIPLPGKRNLNGGRSQMHSGHMWISNEDPSNDLTEKDSLEPYIRVPPVPPHRIRIDDTKPTLIGHQAVKIESVNSNDSTNTVPPVPPHRNKLFVLKSSQSNVSSNGQALIDRPKHLQLQNKNSVDCSDKRQNYHSMIMVLDRLKESNA